MILKNNIFIKTFSSN